MPDSEVVSGDIFGLEVIIELSLAFYQAILVARVRRHWPMFPSCGPLLIRVDVF